MLISLTALAAAAAAEKKGGLPQLNVPDFAPQLFWLALTFGLLYLILSRFSLPRIETVIEERRNRIQRDLDEAERLKQETERALANYEKALGDARTRAGAIAKDTRAKLTAEVDGERARVDAAVAAKLRDAEARITATKAGALKQVGQIAAETAAVVVSELAGIQPTADELARAMAGAPKE